MIKKKICMLGAFAVGKTSLVQRYISGIFSEKYFTTIGVKIDKKSIMRDGDEVELLLWDIYGEDKFQSVESSYFRGASGYLLVLDGTRKDTLDTAIMLRKRIESTVSNIPYIVVLNKSDVKSEWEFDKEEVNQLFDNNITLIESSAKTGQNVEQIFQILTEKIMED